MSTVSPEDLRALRRDKYDDDPDADLTQDLARLSAGEPLAYVIGWIPFHGLALHLDSRPLIPRPETEWWTGRLVDYLQMKCGDVPFTLLDLCAGSGAIGLVVLRHFPNARVTFAELSPAHTTLIQKNLEVNGLDQTRAAICTGDLFAPLAEERFDIIVTNPPYVPVGRVLPESVVDFEPSEALFAGPMGLDIITHIARDAREHLAPEGELWLECDMENGQEARRMLLAGGAISAVLCPDQYGRDRFVVAYYP